MDQRQRDLRKAHCMGGVLRLEEGGELEGLGLNLRENWGDDIGVRTDNKIMD